MNPDLGSGRAPAKPPGEKMSLPKMDDEESAQPIVLRKAGSGPEGTRWREEVAEMRNRQRK